MQQSIDKTKNMLKAILCASNRGKDYASTPCLFKRDARTVMLSLGSEVTSTLHAVPDKYRHRAHASLPRGRLIGCYRCPCSEASTTPKLRGQQKERLCVNAAPVHTQRACGSGRPRAARTARIACIATSARLTRLLPERARRGRRRRQKKGLFGARSQTLRLALYPACHPHPPKAHGLHRSAQWRPRGKRDLRIIACALRVNRRSVDA